LKDSGSPPTENLQTEADDRALILAFALRRGPSADNAPDGELIEASNREEFLSDVMGAFSRFAQKDILRRAITYTSAASGETIEIAFISLYAALESTLTFFRHEGDYEILARDDFARLERELKKWLRQHPLLQHDSARRALIYEKVRELNRFPFSHVFKKFCEQYGVNLADLWPVSGRPEEWPLAEIRHRLVHGDPFVSRPPEALACARQHLRWTVERMILSILGWPVSRSHASEQYLSNNATSHRDWRDEQAKFA
jgi:hypothetical protein